VLHLLPGESACVRVHYAYATMLNGGRHEVVVIMRTRHGKAVRLLLRGRTLPHRAAYLYSELEIAEAVVIKAQQLLDGGSERAELMVSVAKAKAARACNLAVREGVQMHGGVGMTDEYDIGLYMKRERALTEFMGDANYHAERVAQLSGY
jgi:alkylation response protein AidB-like acyl-CoA dehydrogenase